LRIAATGATGCGLFFFFWKCGLRSLLIEYIYTPFDTQSLRRWG
jgi:hypothetical protein